MTTYIYIMNMFRAMRKACFSSNKQVRVYVRENVLQMVFPLLNGTQLFYVNESYTFGSLKEALELELSIPVEVDLSNTSLENDDNLIDYLLHDKQNPPVRIHIQKELFQLYPAYAFEQASPIKQRQQLSYTPVTYYQNQLKENIDPSHANTLSWLLNQMKYALDQNKQQSKLTKQELTKMFEQNIAILAQPVKERLFLLQHELNLLDAEISRLQGHKDAMDLQIYNKGWQWMSGIFGISIIQLCGFYWGIYIQWDWEVCEPVTYSVQMLSVLLGVRFYWKYKKSRETSSILESFMLKQMKKDREWKERYEHLSETINLKNDYRTKLSLHMMILKNRINYHHYIQNIEQKAQLP